MYPNPKKGKDQGERDGDTLCLSIALWVRLKLDNRVPPRPANCAKALEYMGPKTGASGKGQFISRREGMPHGDR